MTASSSDGSTWMVETNLLGVVNAVAFGNDRFVAVTDRGQIVVSSDGAAWVTAREGGPLEGVAFGGGWFVAVDAFGMVWSSPDGTVWAEHYSSCVNALRCGLRWRTLRGCRQ